MSIWSTAKSFINPAKYADFDRMDDAPDDGYDDEEYDDEPEDYEKSGGFFSKRKNKSKKSSKYDKKYDADDSDGSFSYGFGGKYGAQRNVYGTTASKGRTRPTVIDTELYVITSESFDGSADIVKAVKSGKVVIFDVSPITSSDEARRVVDYISGAAEGMECAFSRLFPCIFCIAPVGVTINVKKPRYR